MSQFIQFWCKLSLKPCVKTGFNVKSGIWSKTSWKPFNAAHGGVPIVYSESFGRGCITVRCTNLDARCDKIVTSRSWYEFKEWKERNVYSSPQITVLLWQTRDIFVNVRHRSSEPLLTHFLALSLSLTLRHSRTHARADTRENKHSELHTVTIPSQLFLSRSPAPWVTSVISQEKGLWDFPRPWTEECEGWCKRGAVGCAERDGKRNHIGLCAVFLHALSRLRGGWPSM